jgi:phosphoribosylanthranilate isomerase
VRRIRIKVCGIVDEREAVECVHLGVDAVGFHFWPESPRAVTPRVARRIVERLPVFVAKVGVFVDEEPARIRQIGREVGLTVAQLHGDEPPDDCESLAPLAWIKAFRVGPAFSGENLARYACTTYLLDAWRPERPGGATERFDWRRARRLALHGKIVIAGGLDPGNVATAIEEAEPYAVDVASGVEMVPGRKDLDRVEAFVQAVRRAESAL